MRHLQVRLLVTIVILAVLYFSVPVAAQEITPGSQGTISVRAAGVPLERLLQLLTELSPFEKVVVKDGVGARLVTLTLENVTVRHALVQALDAARVHYVLGARRLVVGDPRFEGTVGSSASSSNLQQRNHVDKSDADAAVAAAEAATAADLERAAIEGEMRSAELVRLLSPPALPIPPGGVIELPFPGPDGQPLTVVKPVKPAPAMPFPVSPNTPAVAAPRSTDPRVQQLLDALTPKRPPGK